MRNSVQGDAGAAAERPCRRGALCTGAAASCHHTQCGRATYHEPRPENHTLVCRAMQGPLRSGLAGEDRTALALPPAGASLQNGGRTLIGNERELAAQVRALQLAREQERAHASARFR